MIEFHKIWQVTLVSSRIYVPLITSNNEEKIKLFSSKYYKQVMLKSFNWIKRPLYCEVEWNAIVLKNTDRIKSSKSVVAKTLRSKKSIRKSLYTYTCNRISLLSAERDSLQFIIGRANRAEAIDAADRFVFPSASIVRSYSWEAGARTIREYGYVAPFFLFVCWRTHTTYFTTGDPQIFWFCLLNFIVLYISS